MAGALGRSGGFGAGADEGASGRALHVLEELDVIDPETMQPVPRDGATMGEVMFRGNIVMKGYLKNKSASEKAFHGGWFHSGDLGVMHPDGYIQLKDRSKDIIISGGENISSIEVEDVLFKHPKVSAAAVVAAPDDKWGETPCAFVELREGEEATPEEIIDWSRKHLAHFKCPRHVDFRSAAENVDRQDFRNISCAIARRSCGRAGRRRLLSKPGDAGSPSCFETALWASSCFETALRASSCFETALRASSA